MNCLSTHPLLRKWMQSLKCGALIICATMMLSLVAEAGTKFYVDSDWTGTKSGTASRPFSTLDTSAWSTINTALASGDVTVYFSAREAGSDTNDYYDTAGNRTQREIDLNKRTDSSSNRLTFDGKSFYNTSDSSPSWSAYIGSNMCVVRDFCSQNTTRTKISNITIHGFRILCNDTTKAVSISGDNFTLENCDISHGSGSEGTSGGPCILINPSANAAHGGSNSWSDPLNNITIQNNKIHDTNGEGIYVGGGGHNMGEVGDGYPSHSNISILNNEIYNTAVYGGQGDGIDVKGGVQGLIVRGNNIYEQNIAGAVRGIVCQGQTVPPDSNGNTLQTHAGVLQVYERNYIHDSTAIHEGIAIVDTWGVPSGVVIRNNILSNLSDSSESAGYGMALYASQDQVLVQSNTVYNCSNVSFIGSTGGSYLLRNNLMINNNAGGNQVNLVHGTINSDYNAHSHTWENSSEGAHSIALSSGDVIRSLVNPVGGNFHLLAGAPVTGRASVQTTFSDDHSGATRGSSWDIGAFNYTHAGPPSAPANLRVIP